MVKQGDTNEESSSGLSQYNGDMKITRYGGGSLVVNLRIRRFGVRVPASAPFLFCDAATHSAPARDLRALSLRRTTRFSTPYSKVHHVHCRLNDSGGNEDSDFEKFARVCWSVRCGGGSWIECWCLACNARRRVEHIRECSWFECGEYSWQRWCEHDVVCVGG